MRFENGKYISVAQNGLKTPSPRRSNIDFSLCIFESKYVFHCGWIAWRKIGWIFLTSDLGGFLALLFFSHVWGVSLQGRNFR